jgi:hypothetical protein
MRTKSASPPAWLTTRFAATSATLRGTASSVRVRIERAVPNPGCMSLVTESVDLCACLTEDLLLLDSDFIKKQVAIDELLREH